MKRKSGEAHKGWKASAKKYKAENYTHSIWSGEKYDRPQTQEELTAESKTVIASSPTTRRATKCDDEMMVRLFGSIALNSIRRGGIND